MKSEEDLNIEFDWDTYKMKKNYYPFVLLGGSIIYGVLAFWFLWRFIQPLNRSQVVIFIFGITFATTAILFFRKFIRHFI